jgi:hypothetical protein
LAGEREQSEVFGHSNPFQTLLWDGLQDTITLKNKGKQGFQGLNGDFDLKSVEYLTVCVCFVFDTCMLELKKKAPMN